MKFMLARDVWPAKNEDGNNREPLHTTARGAAVPARIPAGLEAGGRWRLLESSLALLQRAQRLRETGGLSSPLSSCSSPRGDRRHHHRHRLSGSPLPVPRSPKALLQDSSPGGGRGVGGGAGGEGGLQEKPAARKRRKLFEVSSTSGPSDSARVRGGDGGGGQEEAKEKYRAVGGREGAEEDDEGEDDVLRWQVPFVMGRLCVQLGRDPRTVLENLAQALRLAQVICDVTLLLTSSLSLLLPDRAFRLAHHG